MSENLAILGAYSAAMERGDREAVFEYWSPDFVSHVTERVAPEFVGTDVRGQELEWWTQARNAFPDMVFSVELLIESNDLIVSNWMVRGTHTGTAFYDSLADEGPEPGGGALGSGGAVQRFRGGQDGAGLLTPAAAALNLGVWAGLLLFLTRRAAKAERAALLGVQVEHSS